jgi:aminoglycoside 6'-N-acetyltransferase
MDELRGPRLRVRATVDSDVDALVAIRATPEVHAWWRGDDLEAEIRSDIFATDFEAYTIEDLDGTIIGGLYCEEADDADYRHASVDIFLDPTVRGQGLGGEAITVLAKHMFGRGHHRLTIDPAVENTAAIRAYSKVGFRPVGVMRKYELGRDGAWHDGLLMDLLAEELVG